MQPCVSQGYYTIGMTMKQHLTKQRVLEIIRRFSSARVLIIGDIMVDHFIWGKVSRISPEAPVPVVLVTDESQLLGGCANVLNNVCSMGGQAYISGAIGDDAMGQWVIDELEKVKVDTRGIIRKKNRQTPVKTRIIAHRQQVVRFDRENRRPVDMDDIQKIIAYVKSVKDQIGAIIVSDYNKGFVSETLLDEVRRIVEGTPIALCIDPKQSEFSFYRGCDMITPNQNEAAQALGSELASFEDVIEGGTALMKAYDFKSLLITRGEEGMVLFERKDGIVYTPIPAVAKEVYDVTGAGDTVIGIFALSVAAGASSEEAAVLANHAAGIVVGKVGTATASQQELVNVLS